MFCFRNKNKQKTCTYKKDEIPPQPPISSEALAVVWNEDKTKFCEVIYAHGSYRYSGWILYDDEVFGYHWSPIHDKHCSFFDTPEKAKQEAEDFLQGK